MADIENDDIDDSFRIQRDLGIAAAKAEENRRFLEIALAAEQNCSRELTEKCAALELRVASADAAASLAAEQLRAARKEAEAHKVSKGELTYLQRSLSDAVEDAARAKREASDLRLRLVETQESTVDMHSEVNVVWQQLTLEQETSNSLRLELDEIKQKIHGAENFANQAWQQLAAEQETSSNLRAELEEVAQKLIKAESVVEQTSSMQASDHACSPQKVQEHADIMLVPALRAEVEQRKTEVDTLKAEMVGLRQQLNLTQRSASEAVSLKAELDSLRCHLEHMEQDASANDEESFNEGEQDPQAEIQKLRRELRGMKNLCSTLEKKVRTYEVRLLEHSKAMTEINDAGDDGAGYPNNIERQDGLRANSDAPKDADKPSWWSAGGSLVETLRSSQRAIVDANLDAVAQLRTDLDAAKEMFTRGPLQSQSQPPQTLNEMPGS